jgi:hypothetical protein
MCTSGAIKAGDFVLDKLSETAHPQNDPGELETPLRRHDMRILALALLAAVPACTVVKQEVVYVPFDRVMIVEVPAEPEVQPKEKVRPVLTTAVFESGEMTLAKADAADLEAFLQDLNRRKDNDYAQNGGQPGMHSAYLWEWVQKVMVELRGRGYYSDEAGDFFTNGGRAVALR